MDLKHDHEAAQDDANRSAMNGAEAPPEGTRPRRRRLTVPLVEVGPRQILAGAFVLAGLVAIGVGWFGVSGVSETWQQIPYLVSGAIGGLALVIVGVLTYLSHEHSEDRKAIATLLRRLDELELGLAGEFDVLAEHLNGSRSKPRKKA